MEALRSFKVMWHQHFECQFDRFVGWSVVRLVLGQLVKRPCLRILMEWDNNISHKVVGCEALSIFLLKTCQTSTKKYGSAVEICCFCFNFTVASHEKVSRSTPVEEQTSKSTPRSSPIEQQEERSVTAENITILILKDNLLVARTCCFTPYIVWTCKGYASLY